MPSRAELSDRLRLLAPQLMLRDASRFAQLLQRAGRGQRIDEARLARDLEVAQRRAESRRRLLPRHIHYPEALPVTRARDELLEAIRKHSVLVVCGETGSGKSTQLPKLLLEAGCGRRGLIGHTQPRRLAARALAGRIAEELKVPVGGLVGFETRFDKRVGEQSLIKLMTDGILLAELSRDRWLETYDALIIDEAHERSLNIDFLLGRLAQIRQRRPELKIIVTSATLDPERLSAHFGGAPILTVSGRSFPVEVRYREAEKDEDLEDQVARGIESLWRPRPDGDVLVFLPGEREINDCARLLPKRFPHAQVLPLYSRLPATQQDRVFSTGGPPRIVLATNVAETSVTVPGIRYVVDTGSARINRYSTRLGVQQLHVEPISQAASNQRAGRCGRVGPGICLRLYAEEDFAKRELFTDPEILRSNLAGVILQMQALRLGAVEDFPWIDAPASRHVTEGYRLLELLGAMEGEAGERRITRQGQELARLPLDPRIARIAIAGRDTPCPREVAVLAAALSVQDPHEVPPDKREAARQKHAEWRHLRSDFLTLLQLWQRWRQWREELSNRDLRRACSTHFLSFTRMLEWDQVFRQVADALGGELRETKLTPDELYAPLHQALLSGLIDHIGYKQPAQRLRSGKLEAGEYLGPRGRKFRIFPGSGIAKKAPAWVMSAQLVQTSQLFARTNAAIEIEWLETAGAHLLKRSYQHPEWNAQRGEVTATEHGSLLGLPLYKRVRHYGSIEPAEARGIFILEALVRGNLPNKPQFLKQNFALIESLREQEIRLRRPDLLADEEQWFAFYDARIPADMNTVAALKKWLHRSGIESRQGGVERHTLLMEEADVLRRGASTDVKALFPDHLEIGELSLRLSYRHDPGSDADGVVIHLPLALLHRLDTQPFDWLVPGLRPALFEGLLRSLPNALRRHCTPAAEYGRALAESLSPADGALLPALCARFKTMTGFELKPEDFEPDKLEPHLRPWFLVEDERGRKLAEGASLEVLQHGKREAAREALNRAAGPNPWVRDKVEYWDFGDLPDEAHSNTDTGTGARGIPALALDQGQLRLRLFESRDAAEAAHRVGVRALLMTRIADRVRDLRKSAQRAFGLSLVGTELRPDALAEDLAARLVDEVLLAGAAPRTQADFQAAFERRGQFSQTAYRSLDEIKDWLAQASVLRIRIGKIESAWPESAHDMRQQIESLLAPGFAREIPGEAWPRIPVYLKALSLRLDRLSNKPQRDLELTTQVAPLTEALPSAWHPARWILEEWRVLLFAQELKALGGPNAQRIRECMGQPSSKR